MDCQIVQVDGVRAIVCGDHRRPKCKACGKPSDRQCDWKMPGKRSGTCDAHVCSSCAVQPAPEKDLCPAHAKDWEVWKQSKAVRDGEGKGSEEA